MNKIKYWKMAMCMGIKVKSKMSVIISIIGIFTAFLPMLIALKLAEFTDRIQLLFEDSISMPDVFFSLGTLLGLYLLQTIFLLTQAFYIQEDKIRIKKYIKEKIMICLSKVPYKYIENYEGFREKIEFINKYAAEKTIGSISLVFKWLADLISFLCVVRLLLLVNVWIVVILIVTCVPAVILAFLQKDETYRMRTKWLREGSLTIHYSDICRQNEPIKEIRYWGLYKYIKNKWRNLSQQYIHKKRKIVKKHLIYNSIADLLRNGVYVFVVILLVQEIFQNPNKGLSTFMLVMTSASQLQNITTDLLINAIGIMTDFKYMEDFFAILENDDNDNISLSSKVEMKDIDISFKNVSFSYPGSNKKAINNISVDIKQGEKIAIVGLNGSGKSTFVNLLCGFYEPDKGEITVNNVRLSSVKKQLQSVISVIFQKFCQYHDTLENNIIISETVATSRQNDIIEIMKKIGLNDNHSDKQISLNQEIGLFSDEGRNLSGGQWQKIAITRALYKKAARIYILDEPTSALDPISEANIYKNIQNLTEDKTTLLISHRLGITSVVDRILVFEDGRIIEDGNHDTLMKRNGRYAELYRAQARWYKV